MSRDSITAGISLRPHQVAAIKAVTEEFGVSRSRIVDWMIDDAMGLPTPQTYRDIVNSLRSAQQTRAHS